MISLCISFAVLIVGYIVYGRLTERVFSPDDRQTPAIAAGDGVDCVPMKRWKSFLVQLLNIAGTGPIFGALMGAQFGPVVFIWIVAGSILGGAVHDYMTGMISSRNGGKTISELSGIYLGGVAKWAMRVFSVVLLLLVGTAFVTSPAALLAQLTPAALTPTFWIIVILFYYVLATLLPIDKLIGRLYPVFGIILIVMAAGIFGCILFSDNYTVPELTLQNLHPDGQPVWPYMCVTVACGAISGFHATQSPLIAKCITTEKDGRSVFYGAMIAEAVIALVWAAAGVAFYGTTEALQTALADLGQSGVVYDISFGLMGKIGGILAVVGVVICPISSGDTAFRGARIVLSECFHIPQKKLKSRLLVTLPLLVIGAVLTQIDFDVLWRYFSWSNQTLAMIALWVSTSYLIRHGKNRFGSLLTAIPAYFMSAVSMTYILMAPEGFGLSTEIAYPVGMLLAAVLLAAYLVCLMRKRGSGQAPVSI
ncbi:MAG: carbon starvation protein A [Clostridia bacterium]|nr:carbon starvation protein A [Clostridia bacterium]